MKTRFPQSICCTLLLACFGLSAAAQKLPDIQQNNFPAPAGIRIDGKNTEWNDSFQASNKRTNIVYTLANDDKNLYLAVKSTDVGNNTKIMAGGITFSVNPDGKKKEKESITLTYPIINRANLRGGQGGGRRQMGAMMGFGGGGGGQQISAKQRDSIMGAMQRTQLANAKEIKINGFKTTADSTVSIYNEFGIKAVATVDKDNVYFYEMAIPLEALGLTKDSAGEIAYNIRLNGLQLPGYDGGGFGGGGFGGGRGNFGGGGGGFGQRGGSGIDFQALMSPTDFWGKYALSKK